jgi:hypothetical protein
VRCADRIASLVDGIGRLVFLIRLRLIAVELLRGMRTSLERLYYKSASWLTVFVVGLCGSRVECAIVFRILNACPL